MQLAVEIDQALADELHAPVAPGQGIEDLPVEHECHPHSPGCPQRMVERGVIVGAQVATAPHQRAVE
jgi:hypothetical protein